MSTEQERASQLVQYAVLAAPVDHEIEIKRSRFLCRLRRVDSEDDARDVIAEARADHRLARHHCSAFVIGPDRSIRRSNDDGEPAGTAGTPMLDALVQRETGIEGGELSDVVAVVIRYFGGVLLGAGGLVRAYSDAVSASLDRATLRTRQRRRILSLDAPHAEAGRWEHDLRTADVVVLDTAYGATGVTMQLAVVDTPEALRELEARVATLTQGRRSLLPVGESWVDL